MYPHHKLILIASVNKKLTLPKAKDNPEVLGDKGISLNFTITSLDSMVLVVDTEGERAKMAVPTLEDFLYIDIVKSIVSYYDRDVRRCQQLFSEGPIV